MDLEQALKIVRAAGYRVSRPRRKRALALRETNPHKHPFPHAKLRNITLTSITRLNKIEDWGAMSRRMVSNNDPRNFMFTRAAEAESEIDRRVFE